MLAHPARHHSFHLTLRRLRGHRRDRNGALIFLLRLSLSDETYSSIWAHQSPSTLITRNRSRKRTTPREENLRFSICDCRFRLLVRRIRGGFPSLCPGISRLAMQNPRTPQCFGISGPVMRKPSNHRSKIQKSQILSLVLFAGLLRVSGWSAGQKRQQNW